MKKIITKKLSILWKFIFYSLFLFSSLVIIGVFVAPEIPGVGLDLKIVIAVSLLLNLLGIYGLAWRKRIISMVFWKAFFVAIIISNIYYGFVEIEVLQITTLTDLISTALLSLVLYVPIYIYAFRSKELWEGEVSSDRNN